MEIEFLSVRVGIKALDTMEELEKPLSCIEGRV